KTPPPPPLLIPILPHGCFSPRSGPSESSAPPQRKQRAQGAEQAPCLRQAAAAAAAAAADPVSAAPSPREPGSAQRPASFLFRSSSRGIVRSSSASQPPDLPLAERQHTAPQALDEKELTAQLRKAIESRLNITLAEDLGEALSNGAVLCQLVNHLCPRSVPLIHVPSPAVPKLNAVKRRKNVENFLAACRRIGVPEVSLCSASDILCGEVRGVWRPLEALLLQCSGEAETPTPMPRPNLAGFSLFYVCLMLLLYLAYCKLGGY
uniref:Calponin-homology (CH) domain-containing protein n=1 Tax=Sphenodon punctatus TaxID=8508 RepID=A0A8D0HCN7_SPHPU